VPGLEKRRRTKKIRIRRTIYVKRLRGETKGGKNKVTNDSEKNLE
jgi:hypothetical protein